MSCCQQFEPWSTGTNLQDAGIGEDPATLQQLPVIKRDPAIRVHVDQVPSSNASKRAMFSASHSCLRRQDNLAGFRITPDQN